MGEPVIEPPSFSVGDRVTCRFMPGSVGKVSAVDVSTCVLFGHRYKVTWTAHEFFVDGEDDESGWLFESELRAL
jgi:hypothetical protein